MRIARALVVASVCCALAVSGATARASAAAEPVRVALLFPTSALDWLRLALGAEVARDARLRPLDAGLVASAARGAGYAGSLNLERSEARRLGAAIGADAIVLAHVSEGEIPATGGGEARAESFVGLFLVDARSGALLRYRSVTGAGTTLASARERAASSAREEVAGWGDLCVRALDERARARPDDGPAAVEFDFSVREPGPGEIAPRFFRRVAPAMTPDAERANAVATVDLVVDFRADGTYGAIEVRRWAGFGLDEASAAAVRAATFWPARAGGKLVNSRALIRFNFRVVTE